MLRLIVHADTDEDFNGPYLRDLSSHHFETMDHSIFGFEFPEKYRLHKLRIKTFRTIVNSNRLSVF